jgi:photosystem II stability/assembly factor-like uncharacterized protein
MKNNFGKTILVLTLLFSFACTPQEKEVSIEITPLECGWKTSFRGIASKGDKIWLAGNEGTLLHSENSGKAWTKVQLPGADSLDFRDIAILDDLQILVLSIGNGQDSRIYKSKDGGENWRTVLINQKEAAFFNGFDFWDATSGILISDPIDEKPYLLQTNNAGESWSRIDRAGLPQLSTQEYGFAASGTGVCVLAPEHIWIATGGDKARVFHSENGGKSWLVKSTPMASGNASSGIFSIDFRDAQNGIGVGGDYQDPEAKVVNIIRTEDGGNTWTAVNSDTPFGQKSCVQHLTDGIYIATGRTGVIWTKDNGLSWQKLSDQPYYTISYDATQNIGFLAGPEGNVARFELKK